MRPTRTWRARKCHGAAQCRLHCELMQSYGRCGRGLYMAWGMYVLKAAALGAELLQHSLPFSLPVFHCDKLCLFNIISTFDLSCMQDI